jgi:Na+-transporting methylmalonyl-CoA/oxaloacetate decarboxylase gamma subunit
LTFSDALIVTVLGMGVVFSGLLLTAGLILCFGCLQRLFDTPSGTAKGPTAGISLEPSLGPVIDPEVLAVITTVLEVERRLHRVRGAGARETVDE